jgi:hypothetical protein
LRKGVFIKEENHFSMKYKIDTSKSLAQNMVEQVKFDNFYIRQLAHMFNKDYDYIKSIIDKYILHGKITTYNQYYMMNFRTSALGVKAYDKKFGTKGKRFDELRDNNYRFKY